MLSRWITRAPDRDHTRKRLYITVGTPCAVLLLASSRPLLAVLGSFATLILIAAWYAHAEPEEMVLEASDFAQPYQVGEHSLTGREVLEVFLQEHPAESLDELAERLSTEHSVTPEELEKQLLFWGISPPLRTHPSPVDPEGPSEPPKGPSPAGSDLD